MHTMPAAVIRALAALPMQFEVVPCDPDRADTARFCAHYGYALEDSANTILVSAKTGEKRTVACVLLADSRLDVNHTVRKLLESRRVSFTSADKTRELTGMEIGGVTPIGLPDDLPIWVDARVMERQSIILGGGDRYAKIVTTPKIFKHLPNSEIIAGLAQVSPD